MTLLQMVCFSDRKMAKTTKKDIHTLAMDMATDEHSTSFTRKKGRKIKGNHCFSSSSLLPSSLFLLCSFFFLLYLFWCWCYFACCIAYFLPARASSNGLQVWSCCKCKAKCHFGEGFISIPPAAISYEFIIKAGSHLELTLLSLLANQVTTIWWQFYSLLVAV